MAIIASLAKTLLGNKQALREEALIGQVLTHFHSPQEVEKLERFIVSAEKNQHLAGTPLELMDHSIIALGKPAEGSITYGHAIAHDALEHVRIRVSPEFDEPKFRYFRRLAAQDGTKVKMGEGNGLSASAWLETNEHGAAQLLENGTCDIRLCYPGYTGKLLDGMAHTLSMAHSLGREFPQIHEVPSFIDKALEAAKAEGVVGRAVSNSWSMGAANALASNTYLKSKGVSSAALLGDAWGSSHAADYLSKPANLKHLVGSHAEAVRHTSVQRQAIVGQDVISFYPAIEKDGVWLRQSLTASGPAEYHKPVVRWVGERTGAFGHDVGTAVHLNIEDMETVGKVGFLGDSHHRNNAILQLTRGDHVLIDAPSMGLGHTTGFSRA